MHRQFRLIPLLFWTASCLCPAVRAVRVGKAAEVKSSAVVVNGIAAEIGGRPITLQDVYLFRGLDKVRTNEGNLLELDTGDALHNSIQKYLLEEMVFGEMKSLNVDGGPKNEAVKVLEGRKKNPGFRREWERLLAHYGIGEEKAVQMVWRSLQVEKFIEKKVDTLTPLITADMIDRYLDANTPKWNELGEERLRELRQRAERLLRRERMSEQLKEWVLRLKRKYSVVAYL